MSTTFRTTFPNAALILVDLQIDFCPGGALEVAEGDLVVPIANALAKQFNLVVASQDWHPADHKSFAANHPWRKIGQVIELNGLDQVLWPIHCVNDTFGALFAPGLDQSQIDHVIQKGTDPEIDSYSAFFDNGHRKATGMESYLRDKAIEHVFVLGLATDYCVKFTALDAVNLGFKTYLFEQACRGVNLQPGDVEKAKEEMRNAGVQIIGDWETFVAEPIA
ncbi:MAG: bifunctional nicotinamidase/pyrazinamidase [Bacteroidota bacterium]